MGLVSTELVVRNLLLEEEGVEVMQEMARSILKQMGGDNGHEGMGGNGGQKADQGGERCSRVCGQDGGQAIE